MANSYKNSLQVGSPAYSLIAKMRSGDIVTISGIITDEDASSNCDMQQHDLTNEKFTAADLWANIETLNARLTRVPPPVVADTISAATPNDMIQDASGAASADNATTDQIDTAAGDNDN